MSESIDLIPLRCSAGDLKTLFFGTRNPYEDLMAFKDKSFESSEDFIQEVKRVIHFIKNDARPLDYQDFYYRTTTSFAFVYQKIDGLYRQKSIELQSKDLSETKEKEIKSILRDLLKCELEIERIGEAVDNVYDGYNPILYEQLETLFDDCELLDLLLLVLSKKLRSDKMTEPLKAKSLYFISPFLKLFYGGNGDILDFLRDHQGFLNKSNAVEDVQKAIEKLLSQYTDLNENEISRFCEEIKSPSGLRQIVTKEKHRFKEEKGYYEVLGNLSLLLCLWKQKAAGSEVFLPLARIGLAGYMFVFDGWNTKKGIEKTKFDRYLKLNSLNLKDKVDLPIQLLKDLIKRDLNEVDLRLLELSFSAFGYLTRFVNSGLSSPAFKERLEECIDNCLLISERSKSFFMHELSEFLDSKILTLNEMQSSYLIGSSLSENLISEWLPFFEEISGWYFAGGHPIRTFQFKEKYFSSLKILLHDLMEFITFEERAFLTLPEYLQANLIHACSALSEDDRLFAKSDLERIFFDAQDIGIAYLRGPRHEKSLLRFKTLIKVVKVPGAKNGVPFGDESQSEDFIKKIYESKLIEEFIVAYEENKSFLQTAGDLNVTEAVWELFDFLAKFSLKDASFLTKERNLNFLKYILQDSCEIDPRAVNRQCYEAFLSGIESLMTKTAFAGHLKEEKLFFGILRLYVFRPFLNSWHDEQFPDHFYNALIQKEKFLHLFGKFLEVFENKMRDPSLDLYDSLKQFENAIGKENYFEKKAQQSYLADKEAPIINEKISFNSLRNFAGGFCKRVAPFVGKMPYVFDLNEQVGLLTKRFGRMIVDPLLVFGCNQNFPRTLRNAFEDICYSDHEEVLIFAFEGVFAGIIDICKEFKLNEYSVISKFDAKRLSKMVTKIATIHYLRKEDISTDITYQEAALMSLLIGLVNFNRFMGGYDKTPCKEIEKLGDQFKEATELIDQVKNNILKCFSLETVKESRDVQALAKDCKIIFEGPNFYLNLWTDVFNVFYRREALQTSTNEVYKTILKRFNLDYEIPNGQNEKSVLGGIVYNTLRLKEMSLSLCNVDQDLFATMITSPEGLKVMLQLELYLLECANHYCDSKTKDLVITLADILEACFTRINPSHQKDCFENDGKILLQVIIDFLKKLAEIQIQRNCKALLKKNLPAVFVFIRAIYEFYSTFMKEKVALEKLEEAKATLIGDYKNEIQRYIDAVVQCQHHSLGNLKKLFVVGQEFKGAIPLDYWIKLSEQLSGDLALYVRNLLQGSSDNEIKLQDFSEYKAVNQIYQLNFLYRRLEQLFIKEIINNLSLDKDLIEGLLMATKQTLQSLVSEDLTLFAKGKDCLDFPETLVGFISRISKLAINYIVSCALKNETDSLLSMCLNLAESFLDAQKSILTGLRRDIFSGSKSCYQSVVSLINTILRANKILRVEFINRGMLGRILTVERLSGFTSDEITSVLFLMATLLEDSLTLDSQVDVALKSAMKKSSKISLEDLMKDKNFKSLQNYKQVLEKLKLYGIKSNGENEFSVLVSDLGKDQNCTETLSPVAEECLQILLKSLIESFSFEKESIASLVKVNEQQESGQRKQLSKRGIFPRSYLLVDQEIGQEDETFDEPNVYLNEDLNREMILKDSSALVVILSGILSSYPHLIPSVTFQEVSIGDILKSDDSDLMNYFKSNSRWSIYDILLRLVLLKDGNSAVFLVASFIEENKITVESVELKYLLLLKTFEILKDILDCEETQGKAVEALNSVLMRRNIAMMIGFINEKVNEGDHFQNKEEILQLVMQITQKLLHNPQMIAYSMQIKEPSYSMIRIISDNVKQNTSKSMSREEVAGNYANILRALKTRESHEPKLFPTNFKEIFEKNLLVKKESQDKINYEDQKKFEMWEERSQWEKEEIKRLLEIAGLKENELLSEVKLAAGANGSLSRVFNENSSKEVSENLKILYEAKQGEDNSKLGYLLGKLKDSNILGQCQMASIQNLGDNIDEDILLPLLKVDFSRIEEIKNDTSLNIIQSYVQEQTEGLFEEVEKQNSPPPPSVQENEEKYEEIQVDKQEEKEEEEVAFRYFMNQAVKSEENFKFRVNKALQHSKRLKEVICLEQTLQGSNERNEQIVKEFTSKMTEFDKNVVYASLGKKFEAGLSEELLKIIHRARKELLAIQQDFGEYEEANNKAGKVEDDIDGEDEEYGDLDYDFQFLAVDDDEKEGESNKEDDQEELIEQDEEISSAVEPGDNEKISRLLKSFEVDDHFIMSVLELFFCYFNPSSSNETTITNFLRDSISLNPANELKIIDTMITILYTPEFFDYHLKKQADNYETKVEKILSYMAKYYQEATLTRILFVPKTYLENFGNKLLKNVKESTNFAHKVADCHTVLDMILNLIETPSFSRNEQWILNIVERFSEYISKEKDVKLGENVSQMDSYKKFISCKRILSLLSLIEKPSTPSSLKVQELYLNFKSTPQLFVPLHNSLSSHFYQTIVKMNLVIEQDIRVLKENQLGKIEILENLNVGQFELILTIIFSFANVFHENLGKKSKVSKKLEKTLQTVTGSLFNEEEVKAFFVNIHELTELSNKIQPQDDFKKLLDLLIMICIGHYSIIIMEANLEEKKPKSITELRKQTGGSSLSDIEQMPSLARLISHEDAGEHLEMMAPLQRSYSHYRREVNVDFGAIFANFALKQSSRTSKIATSNVVAGITLVLSNLISIIIPKFPWILDFKSKRELFKMRFEEYLKKNNITPRSTRDVQVDRKNIVFSAMKLFKDCSKNDLIQHNEIEYLNEQGVDGGGLIRDFYETISKQLFDPCVGLFKLAENQISIQPNPMSEMIPYDSTLMQFAGVIVAKAISQEIVMNINFTKPFLKHILGKTITIGDMEEVDADLGKNLRWMLDNNIEDLYLTYTHEIEVLGERRIIELQKGGSDIFVDEENKKEYVKQICEYRMTKQINLFLAAHMEHLSRPKKGQSLRVLRNL